MHPKQLEEIERLREQSRLLYAITILKERFSYLSQDIFLLSTIPEQGEDLYIFALSTDMVCTVEIPRSGEPGFVDLIETFRDFRKRSHSTQTNRTLDAIELIVRR